MGAPRHTTNPGLVQDLECCLGILARVVEYDIGALPIFERIDAELTKARISLSLQTSTDPVARARELVRLQKVGT